MRQFTILVIIIIGILVGVAFTAYNALAFYVPASIEFECVRNKYATTIDRYGIYTGSQENFDYFLGNRLWIPLGSCWDNGKTINLYTTDAQDSISETNQAYLNGYIEKELTELERAIQLVLAAGLTISNE